MKKFKMWYWIIFVFVLIMAITKGFDISIPINAYGSGNFKGDISILLLNLILVLVIWIFLFIVTINKKNTIKSKWLILIGIIFISLFIPVGIHSYYAGVIGKYNKDYVGLFSFIKLIIMHL
ncbi:MAG: hypothetical protein IJF92_01550 [Bacilli bacterium]|nr:hypothetical protein [Bacilli bacterium]